MLPAKMCWCLAKGLRMVQSLTLMTHGLYNEPAGAFLLKNRARAA